VTNGVRVAARCRPFYRFLASRRTQELEVRQEAGTDTGRGPNVRSKRGDRSGW